MKKNTKITKQSHAYRGYVSTYNVGILNFFDPELKPKDTKRAVKNKLIGWLRGFIWIKWV